MIEQTVLHMRELSCDGSVSFNSSQTEGGAHFLLMGPEGPIRIPAESARTIDGVNAAYHRAIIAQLEGMFDYHRAGIHSLEQRIAAHRAKLPKD